MISRRSGAVAVMPAAKASSAPVALPERKRSWGKRRASREANRRALRADVSGIERRPSTRITGSVAFETKVAKSSKCMELGRGQEPGVSVSVFTIPGGTNSGAAFREFWIFEGGFLMKNQSNG